MIVRIFWICTACVLASGSVHAFQQSASGQGTGPSVAIESGSKAAELSDQDGGSKSKSTIVIPGLGSLGVLPKLDFGLELLYGENPDTATEPNIEIPSNEDGLRIKGTLKHRF
jgi:hypothetical protein